MRQARERGRRTKETERGKMSSWKEDKKDRVREIENKMEWRVS